MANQLIWGSQPQDLCALTQITFFCIMGPPKALYSHNITRARLQSAFNMADHAKNQLLSNQLLAEGVLL